MSRHGSLYTDEYDSEDDISIHLRHGHGPAPVPRAAPAHYIQTRERPQSYYATRPAGYGAAAPVYLQPERTMVATRPRSRSHERRSSPPTTVVMPPPPPQVMPQQPVIIKNYNYNDHSSDEESGGGRMHRSRSHSYASHHSHDRSRSRAGSGSYVTREEYELERQLEKTRGELAKLQVAVRAPGHSEAEMWDLKRARRDLEDLRVQQERERETQRTQKEYREEAELRAAKHELDGIKRREEKEAEEKRIKREMELKRLAEEKREEEEKRRRDKEAQEAIARYKQQEAERAAKEKREKEIAEKEFQRRLQEQLISSGVDEKDIKAILEKKKIKQEKQAAHEQAAYAHHQALVERPTYTRMSRRHLSIETLRVKNIDFELDSNPEYVLIRRWVPEDEQDILWRHTRVLREKRDAKLMLTVDDGKHHHRQKSDDANFEWVRKKERKRSKSPALLMYLAGAK